MGLASIVPRTGQAETDRLLLHEHGRYWVPRGLQSHGVELHSGNGGLPFCRVLFQTAYKILDTKNYDSVERVLRVTLSGSLRILYDRRRRHLKLNNASSRDDTLLLPPDSISKHNAERLVIHSFVRAL